MRDIDHEEDWVTTLTKIAEDAEARRELLWIRAIEKGDLATARDLEEVDPDVVKRLGDAALGLSLDGESDREERSRRISALWSATWNRHARRLAGDTADVS